MVPARVAETIRWYAATLNQPTSEVAGLALVNLALAIRRKRSLDEQRAEILHDLVQRRCTFHGPIQRPHRRLADELEAIDSEIGG